MAFKINPNPTFWAKASISVPGQKDPSIIDVEYKHLNKDELKAYQDGLDEKEPITALSEIMVGWKGTDEDFSKDSLAKVLKNYPASGRQFYEAFISELYGAKAKN